jgi:hypothetical protein
MCQKHTESSKLKIAYKLADKLVKIEDDIESLVPIIFDGFHELGFDRVRIYRYRNRDRRCVSWRCCDGHDPIVKERFDNGGIILSPSKYEPDNFKSMREKIPMIIVFDPNADSKETEWQDREGTKVFVTNKDLWYEALGKPKIKERETFEWLDCPLLIGKNFWGKISLDCNSIGKQFKEEDLALIAPLSYLIAATFDQNPIYDYDVFISFNKAQKELALTIALILKQNNLRVFIAPTTIRPGKRFMQEIREAILKSKNILLLFSRECIGNDWIYAECSSSWILDKQNLTVFRIGEIETSELPFFIRDSQCYDFAEQWLIDYIESLKI